jgi:hypothetical protein
VDHDRWTLTAVFDSIEVTRTAGVYEGGLGEAAEFYTFLREYWDSGRPEDLDETIEFTGETVTATCSMIDPFETPLKWLLDHTVPRSMMLTRNVDRGN